MQFFNKTQIKQSINKMLMSKPETRHIVENYQQTPEILNAVIEDLFSDVIEEMYPFRHEPVTPRVFLEDGYYCGKNPKTGVGVAETMYPILKDEFCKVHDIHSNYKEVILTGCVDLDSVIQEADGGLPTLRQRMGKEDDVLVLKEQYGIESSKTVNTRHSGIQKVFKLTLANGMSLRLTPDHRVRVYRLENKKIQWIPCQDVKETDMVLCPRNIKTTPSMYIKPELARLLGYIITNGCYDHYRVRFASDNHASVYDYQSCLKFLGFDSKVSPIKNTTALECHSINSVKSGLVSFVKEKLGDKKTILVPPEIAKSNNFIVANFLNAIWSCEGTVYVGNESTPPRMILAMIDEVFIRQIQLLLLRFGIQSRIRHLRQFDKRSDTERYIWEVIVSGIDNLSKFLSNIGDIVGKEDKCAVIRDYCNTKTSNTNVDIIPIKAKELSNYMSKWGIVRPRNSKWWNLTGQQGFISRNKFDEWLSEYGDTALGQELKNYFHEDVSFIPVSSVTEEKTHIEVGDIGAVNGNRFICNGISVHNSIGYGKSFFMELGLLWHLYLLSCFKNPQEYFGLSQVSKLGVMVISITEKQSKKNIFSSVKKMVKSISYFKENFYFDEKCSSESLQFPRNIEFFNGSSAQSSAIGFNIFSAALDEANFFKVVEKSKRGNNPDGMYDEALVLYNSLLRRQDSRFLKEGRQPGILYVGSSRMYPNDFTEQRIKLAKEAEDQTTYVLDYNLWKVNRDKYTKEEFKVEVGGLNRKSRILDGSETDIVGEVISIPMDFYDKFKKDIDNALRDIAGVAVYSVQPFIGQKEKITEMFDSSIERVFSVDKATLSSKPEYEAVERIVKFRPDNRDKIRYVAMDIGLKKDRMGLAMGYIEDVKSIERTFFNDEKQEMEVIKVRLPIVRVEMLLQIYPEAEFGEVELSRVRFLIFKLKKLGYRIKYASADGFQSADMQQILRRNGINFDYISMDKTTEPYETFRNAMYENRIKCIYHPVLEDELNRLERNYISDKIDHPVKGSKDIADAIGQLVHNCHINMKFQDDSLLPTTLTSDDKSKEETLEGILEDFENYVKGIKSKAR